MKKEKKISLRQKLFCEFYCGRAEGNSYAAAIMAGYSEKYAKAGSYKLLEIVGVKKYIDEINKQVSNNRIAEIKDIQEFWTRTMNNPAFDVKYRLKASEYLAKAKGMFADDW